ncbi:hypothetical protein ACIQPQ_33300 [Streptomyces sp. NPDC091281]|uniref:hypothetical protein n=1 Tax=Streptomyces sp. NPDC091281 TaxID=3365985 RepID=UPI0037F70C78
MTRVTTTVAVTGHTDLAQASVPLVRAALYEALERLAPEGGVRGLSCLADGADSLFAEAVLAAGGRLTAVVPARDYRRVKVRPAHAARFDRLLAAADEVVVLDRDTADRAAYEAANAVLLARADLLLAVWDGRPGTPGRPGGTADAVAAARAAGVPVEVLWPVGAARRG